MAGAQPKLLARREAGRFVADADESEVRARYEMCEDLARQLVQYTLRNAAERPDGTTAQLREKVAASVLQKAFGWGLSPAEAEWVLRRLAFLDPGAQPAGRAT